MASDDPLRILVVDDQTDAADLLERVLKLEGFAVQSVYTGNDAIARSREVEFDVVLLDFHLPDIDGRSVCRQIRQFSAAYIVMVTGESSADSKILALTLGADDYITKPYEVGELVARVHAMARRPRTLRSASTVLRADEVTLDLSIREVRAGGGVVELTRLEYELLRTLLAANGNVVNRVELLADVWKSNFPGDGHLIDVHMSNLRKKLTAAGAPRDLIIAVRGVGFRIASVVSAP